MEPIDTTYVTDRADDNDNERVLVDTNSSTRLTD